MIYIIISILAIHAIIILSFHVRKRANNGMKRISDVEDLCYHNLIRKYPELILFIYGANRYHLQVNKLHKPYHVYMNSCLINTVKFCSAVSILLYSTHGIGVRPRCRAGSRVWSRSTSTRRCSLNCKATCLSGKGFGLQRNEIQMGFELKCQFENMLAIY